MIFSRKNREKIKRNIDSRKNGENNAHEINGKKIGSRENREKIRFG